MIAMEREVFMRDNMLINWIENGKIIDHEFQSPRNGAAFSKLKKLVTRK
jgi:hypothetical protein